MALIRNYLALLVTCSFLLSLVLASSTYSWAACSGSSPTWTSMPDRASVGTCVTSATAGDTIYDYCRGWERYVVHAARFEQRS